MFGARNLAGSQQWVITTGEVLLGRVASPLAEILVSESIPRSNWINKRSSLSRPAVSGYPELTMEGASIRGRSESISRRIDGHV